MSFIFCSGASFGAEERECPCVNRVCKKYLLKSDEVPSFHPPSSSLPSQLANIPENISLKRGYRVRGDTLFEMEFDVSNCHANCLEIVSKLSRSLPSISNFPFYCIVNSQTLCGLILINYKCNDNLHDLRIDILQFISPRPQKM